MGAIQIAIVDDTATDRQHLIQQLKPYLEKERLTYTLTTYGSGEDFLEGFQQQRYDLVFMDVYMTGITGVETAQLLRQRDRDCKLVFLTTTSEFMPQGFALGARHYIIKPVQQEALAQAMENCQLVQSYDVPILQVDSWGQTLNLETRDLLYMDVVDRKAVLHMTYGTVEAGRNFATLSDILLTDCRFLLCIKGVVVNMDYILREDKSSFFLTNGDQLFLAPRRRSELLEAYRRHVFAGVRGGVGQ